jgi:hypothetical protein
MVVGSDVSPIISSTTESGIYSNDQNAVKVPMVLLPDGRRHAYAPSRRDHRRYSPASIPRSYPPWNNIDKDANPELRFRV